MVLPWVPPTATDHFRRISSASISARRTTGSSLARAAITSGLSGFTAEEMTTTSASARFSAAMADLDRDAEVAQALDVGALGDVAALHLVAEVVQDLGDAAHADAADADEMDGADVEGKAAHQCVASRQCGARILRQQAHDEIGQPVGGVAPCRGASRAAGRRLPGARGSASSGVQAARPALPATACSPAAASRRRIGSERAGVGRLVVVGGEWVAAPGWPGGRRRPARRRWRRRRGRSPDAPGAAAAGTSGKKACSSAVDAERGDRLPAPASRSSGRPAGR